MQNLFLSANIVDHQLAATVYFNVGGGELVFKMLWEALEPMIDKGYAYLEWVDAYCNQFKEPFLKLWLQKATRDEMQAAAKRFDVFLMLSRNTLIIGSLAGINVCLSFDRDLIPSGKRYIMNKLLNNCNTGTIWLDF